MNLTKTLRRQNYDLIEGIVRNHAPLQLWGKRPLNEVEIEYEKLEHAFKSDVVLTEIKSPVLDINYSKKNEFKFNSTSVQRLKILNYLNQWDLLILI